MSNVGRPRTGFKPCPHCGSTDRDSNGQCHCRNLAYRAARKAALAATKKAKPAKAQPKPEVKKTKQFKDTVVHTTTEPARYVLAVDGEDERKYARKDAAIKNGVRSGREWTVSYKGKIVATSEI